MPYDKLTALVAEIFNVRADSIELTMTPDDIQQWDSLNHLRLITAIETEFNITLSMKQIQNIQSLRDIQEIVSAGSSAG